MKILPSSSTVSLGLPGNGYVSCDARTSLNDFQSCTIEAWVALATAVPFNTGQSVAMKQPIANDGFGLAFVGATNGTQVSAFFGTSDDVDGGTVTPGEWHHVAAVYDAAAATITVYLDGNEVAQQTNVPPQNLQNANGDPAFLIGAARHQTAGPMSYLTGHIASVRVWNVARCQEDLVNDAVNITVNEPAIDPNLKLLVDFTTVPAVDRAGGNNALTFVNTTYGVTSGALVVSNNSYAASGTNPALDFGGNAAYTIDGWFWPSGSGTLVGKYSGTPSTGSSQWEMHIDFQNGNQLAAWRNSVPTTPNVAPITSNPVITPGNWYHFAATYDAASQIFSLYVNGNLQAAQSFPTPAPSVQGPLMIGAWKDTSGNITNGFNGAIQNVRVWNKCLAQSDIRQWMYNQPVTDPRLVAAFDFTASPPIDTTDTNTITLVGSASQSPIAVSIAVDPTDALLGIPVPVNAACLNQTIDPPVAPPQGITPAAQVVPFSEEFHQRLLEDVLASMPAGLDEGGRAKRRRVFEDAYQRAQKMVRDNPNLLKVVSVVEDGSVSRLVYHGVRGDVVMLDATGSIASCVLWWISWVFTLTIGFLMAIGVLPKIGQIATRLYNLLIRNPVVKEALTQLITYPITVPTCIGFIGVIIQQGLIWPILKLAIASVGFWIAFFVLKTVIMLCTGVAAIAQTLAGVIVWAGQVIALVASYQGSCPEE